MISVADIQRVFGIELAGLPPEALSRQFDSEVLEYFRGDFDQEHELDDQALNLLIELAAGQNQSADPYSLPVEKWYDALANRMAKESNQ